VTRPPAGALAILLALAPGLARAQETPAAPPPAPPTPAVDDVETLPTKVAEVPGTWDLSRDGTGRRCVMTLLRERGTAGQRVNFPAGCRRALPVMAPVAGWLYADEAVRLVDKDIRPILQFKRRPDRRSYVATAEGGETYSFVPLDIAKMRPPEADPPPAAAETAGAVPPLPGSASAPASVPATPAAITPPTSPDGPQPGTYALDRLRQQATCRLAFDPAGAVRLLPGCHDDGIEVFDPVTWRYTGGRLTVTAKRGHSISLVANGDGRWRRDPETGVVFLLRRVEP
jgi:hypothetical protein